MKNRILVIEDDMDISNLICMNLEAVGYEATPLYNGSQAEEFIERSVDYDLALLDLMLPQKDGFSLIEPLTRRQIPVICLTAKGDVVSKVQGLKMGAEDYMVKPFEVLELLVRIEKVLSRTGKEKSALRFQKLKVDLKSRKVWEGENEIHLKPMEFRLLTVFLQNRNVMLPRDKLLDLVWGEEFLGESRTVDVHVAKLRKKLKACEAIITVPRGGYLFVDDETIRRE
ncbi:DNA-binding response regulator [Clostridiaceae bacterium]|nr:DNA-binding response regulator [Clostridiaceae bacterium]